MNGCVRSAATARLWLHPTPSEAAKPQPTPLKVDNLNSGRSILVSNKLRPPVRHEAGGPPTVGETLPRRLRPKLGRLRAEGLARGPACSCSVFCCMLGAAQRLSRCRSFLKKGGGGCKENRLRCCRTHDWPVPSMSRGRSAVHHHRWAA